MRYCAAIVLLVDSTSDYILGGTLCVGGEVSVRCTSRLRCTNLLCMVVLLVYASQCYGMLTNNRREKAVLHCNTFFFAAAVIDIDDID